MRGDDEGTNSFAVERTRFRAQLTAAFGAGEAANQQRSRPDEGINERLRGHNLSVAVSLCHVHPCRPELLAEPSAKDYLRL